MTPADIGLIATIVLVGALAGNELGTLTVIHPALDRLPYASSRPGTEAVSAGFGRVLPVVMTVTVIATFATALALDGRASVLLLIAGTALVAMLVVTFVGLMPLYARELKAGKDTPEEEWRAGRERWMRFHSVRVSLDGGAFVLVTVAAVA
jgi:hypothetical protein